MYTKKTDQTSLLDPGAWLPPGKRARLESSWAGPFRDDILPLLIEAEQSFATFYSPDRGAPNKPVAVVLGMLLLKEAFDLTDAQVVDEFNFNMQWHYALEVPFDRAHICPKTLYNFRAILMADTTLENLFAGLCDRIVKRWNIKTTHHRLDSTHILSNMKKLTRLGLFVKTIEQFLTKLRKRTPELAEALPTHFHENYLERKGCFADAAASGSRRRLEQCAKDLWYLVERFRSHDKVSRRKCYQTMARLLAEQCVVAQDARGEQAPILIDDETPTPAPAGDEGADKPSPGDGTDETPAAQAPPDAPPESAASQQARAPQATDGAEPSDTPEAQPAADEQPDTVAAQPAASEPSDTAQDGTASTDPQNETTPDDNEPAPVALKPAKEIASDSLQNPSDADATYSGHKGAGYQAQLGETCHADNPFQVIDHVKVEGAHESDQHAAKPCHDDLIDRGHSPETTYADPGYISGKNIIEAEGQGVTLHGPAPGKKPKGDKLTWADFEFSADRVEVQRCPAGHAPSSQHASKKGDAQNVHFASADCEGCEHAPRCPAQLDDRGRVLRVTPEQVAIQQRRREESTPAFKEAYKIRSGIEATNSHLKRDRGAARLRVRGSPSVRLRVMLKVLAENVFRAVNHVRETPFEPSGGPGSGGQTTQTGQKVPEGGESGRLPHHFIAWCHQRLRYRLPVTRGAMSTA